MTCVRDQEISWRSLQSQILLIKYYNKIVQRRYGRTVDRGAELEGPTAASFARTTSTTSIPDTPGREDRRLFTE